MIHIQKT